MTTSKDIEEYMVKAFDHINESIKNISDTLKDLQESIKDVQDAFVEYKTLKEIESKTVKIAPSQRSFISAQKLVNLSPKAYDSKLVESSNRYDGPITLAQNLKFSQEHIKMFETINKFYDYKTNPEIIRVKPKTGKPSKYPRFICSEATKPEIVHRLFVHGFLDKVITDESMNSICKLPSIIVESVRNVASTYQSGLYGVQIFDASTDLLGKPIILCQIFTVGNHCNIYGDNGNLNSKIPCELETFQEYLSKKRAGGLHTLIGKLTVMIREKQARLIGQSKGGEVEEIVTIFFEREGLYQETSTLEGFLDRIKNLGHKHAKDTLEYYYKELKSKQVQVNFVTGKQQSRNVESTDPF